MPTATTFQRTAMIPVAGISVMDGYLEVEMQAQ